MLRVPAADARLQEEPARLGLDHHVAYTESKARAEVVLAEEPLPLVVARPSIVVGDSDLGVASSASIFWFFRLMDRLGVLPAPFEGRIDVVPVDWAAKALLALLFRKTLSHRLYHVSAGRSAISFARFAKAFQPGRLGRYRRFRMDEDWAAVADGFRAVFPEGTALNRILLSGSRKYFRFVAQNIAFDNHRLLAEGVVPPPDFAKVISTCLADRRSIAEQFLAEDATSFGLAA